jgi:hypothetical protein
MGEKGIAADAIGSVPAGLVERSTTVVSSVVSSTGDALVDKVRDKGVEAVADAVIADAREAIEARRNADESDDQAGPTDQAPPQQGPV